MHHGIRLFLFLAILAALAWALLTIGDEPEVEVEPVVSGVSVDEQTPAPAVDGPDAPVRAIEEEGHLGGIDDEGLFDPLPADQKQKPEFPGQFGRIRGRVLSAAGQPMPEQVVAFRRDGAPGRSRTPTATTNDLGEYDSGSLVEGNYDVLYIGPVEHAHATGWISTTLALPEGETATHDVRLMGERVLIGEVQLPSPIPGTLELRRGWGERAVLAVMPFEAGTMSMRIDSERLDPDAEPRPGHTKSPSSFYFFGLSDDLHHIHIAMQTRGPDRKMRRLEHVVEADLSTGDRWGWPIRLPDEDEWPLVEGSSSEQ